MRGQNGLEGVRHSAILGQRVAAIKSFLKLIIKLKVGKHFRRKAQPKNEHNELTTLLGTSALATASVSASASASVSDSASAVRKTLSKLQTDFGYSSGQPQAEVRRGGGAEGGWLTIRRKLCSLCAASNSWTQAGTPRRRVSPCQSEEASLFALVSDSDMQSAKFFD